MPSSGDIKAHIVRPIPRMPDLSAQWPSRYHGGPVLLMPGGAYCLPSGAGKCEIGESIVIDPDWPLHAHWNGLVWRYERHCSY
jgi:hypothetical protein